MRSLIFVASLLVSNMAAAAPNLWSERQAGGPALAAMPDFAALAAEMVPVVVSIQVEQKAAVSRGRGMSPPEFFFGPDVPREFRNRGLGSGFFISKDGMILTNHHVVENADRVEVTFSVKGGVEKKLAAKILGVAPEYDVALLQATGIKDAPIAFLGDSDEVKIGQWVVAIGNPFGLSHSVSVGIISAKERRDIAPSGRVGLYDFLQTDASINPGNSGGPLINARGEVIGINSAINAAGSGIGFAIPINMVKAMLPDLKSKGKYTRSWIGVRIQAMSAELAESYGLKIESGALISEVLPKSPAATAGLREGDVVLEFDGKPLRSASDLPLYASMAGVGKTVNIKYWRDRRAGMVKLKLGAFPSDEEQLAGTPDDEGSGLGLVVADITPALQKRLELEDARGALVRSVEPGSPAARAGLVGGDIITAINGKNVTSARDVKRAVDATSSGGLLRLQVQRDKAKRFVAIRKP